MFICCSFVYLFVFFFFKQKTAYELRISDWSSDVCSSDLAGPQGPDAAKGELQGPGHGSEPAEARRLHPCLYDDPEKAELGAPQGCQGPPDQPARSHHLHPRRRPQRSEEHTSELQSLMRISYAVFCLKKKKQKVKQTQNTT